MTLSDDKDIISYIKIFLLRIHFLVITQRNLPFFVVCLPLYMPYTPQSLSVSGPTLPTAQCAECGVPGKGVHPTEADRQAQDEELIKQATAC